MWYFSGCHLLLLQLNGSFCKAPMSDVLLNSQQCSPIRSCISFLVGQQLCFVVLEQTASAVELFHSRLGTVILLLTDTNYHALLCSDDCWPYSNYWNRKHALVKQVYSMEISCLSESICDVWCILYCLYGYTYYSGPLWIWVRVSISSL